MPFVNNKSDTKQPLRSANVRKIFVGRADEIQFFVEHILEPEEPVYNIVSISGNGGVGKSTLIRRFIDEVQSSKFKDCCQVGLVDERQSTPASIMERFADRLSEGGYPLTEFEKALIRHKETLHRLWSEREAGQEASLHEAVDLVGSVAEDLVPGGKFLHKGANMAWDLFMKEHRYRQMRKDADWLENPISELTQKFVDGLNSLTDTMTPGPNRVKRRLRVLLFFDTFERLAVESAPWLLDHLLPSRINTDVVLVIAGRDSIEYSTPDDPKRWLEYKDAGVIHLINLDPFTEEETQTYLAERAITDQEQINKIWHLSGGLPLYLSLLTFNPGKTVDPTADVVANFLCWLPEQEQVKRQLVLMAALFSRPFNQDDLAAFPFVPEQEQAAHYRWLIRLPFMKSNQLDGRCSYHDLVSDLFTLYLHQQSPKEYFATRSILANYYRQLLDNIQAVEGKVTTYSAVKLEIVLALIQQLFHLSDEASHFSATELILRAYYLVEQVGEFARVLRELSQERANNLASAHTRRLANSLLEYIEAYEAEEAEQSVVALSDLLEKIVHHPLCPSSLLALIYRERGSIYRSLYDYRQAITDLSCAIELDPLVARAYTIRGSAYRHLKEYSQAIADFDRAIELDPNYARSYLSRGNAYDSLRDYERAIADYSRAIELHPKYDVAYVNRGECFYRIKDYQRAIADFNRAIELDPEYVRAYAYRGHTYNRLKEYPRALADYDRALELDPTYVRLYSHRADVYLGLKDPERAIADYSSALELGRQDAHIYRRRGSLYRSRKDYQQAIADYNHAIELDPKYASVYISRGLAYRDLKDYGQATTDLNYAIELDSQRDYAYFCRALVHRDLKNYQHALEDLNRALELNPHDADTYLIRGVIYLHLQNIDQARADVLRAQELDAHNIEISWAVECMRILQEGVDTTLAARLERIADLDPVGYYAYICKGIASWLNNQFQETMTQLEQAIIIDADEYDAYYWKGIIFASLGQNEDAIALIEQALELQLPPILLKHFPWSTLEQPTFYENHIVALLEQHKRKAGTLSGTNLKLASNWSDEKGDEQEQSETLEYLKQTPNDDEFY